MKCLVAGCTCKDARMVSRRKAGFFRAQAIANGETADRIIPPEPDLSALLSQSRLDTVSTGQYSTGQELIAQYRRAGLL